ncbi:1,3-beta-glucanosyltransferase Gas4p [[Candida] jaroonii]|uniref:1,3-beta-glucanosyltransferase Gas4p n=1 Tax=[Candida] jaroonii TaxID=467808 RepID=A0ACA9Y6K7_9ASCO|nr:1,3-beta-glucanosyltransferase Gas4p [[Candida] jaroonii]
MFTLVLILFISLVKGYVHPITVHGRYFVDTVTNEPFYIKGVDYQPGGESGVISTEDPLSDEKSCSRDIVLFQQLGINTIRIYSINTDLNHDKCMSMLAAAGIYVVLDVNSPLPNHHLNRYEPWNTYNVDYLENVFKVVEQFSYYNNTLGFFAGNEVINDITSAKNSPVYVKAVVRDTKNYIDKNSPRPIPVGYSAADDLRYRISFSQYLECVDESPAESVDFYGVNSYQWCGEQTFYTSGYNSLVSDYESYTRPLFFSEYGCNEVLPRQFGEIGTMYSNAMVDVFSGGLVYQFTQEPNNYGLVEILDNGDAKVLTDFITLKTKFDDLPQMDLQHVAYSMKENAKEIQNRKKVQRFSLPPCDTSYENIDVSRGLPPTVADELITYGVKVTQGRFVPLTTEELTCPYQILDSDNNQLSISKKIYPVVDYMSGTPLNKFNKIKYHSGMYNNEGEVDSEDDYDFSSDEEENLIAKASIYLKRIVDKVSRLFSS